MYMEAASDYEYQTLIDILAEMAKNHMAINSKQNGEKGNEEN